MRLKHTETQKFRRDQIVQLRSEGKTQSEIAVLLGCTQAWVSLVLKRSKSGYYDNVVPKRLGKQAALDQSDLNALKIALEQGALAHGFETNNWSQERVCQLIEQKFGVSHHPAHVSRILAKIGFTRQKPKRKDYRRDANEVSKWYSERLPKAQKKPGKKAL